MLHLVDCSLVITLAGSLDAFLQPEDDLLELLPGFVLPRLSMPLGICHSDQAAIYTSYHRPDRVRVSLSLALPRAFASRTILHPLSVWLTTCSKLMRSQESRAGVTPFLIPVGW